MLSIASPLDTGKDAPLPLPESRPALARFEPFVEPEIQLSLRDLTPVGPVAYPASYDLRTLGRVTPVKDQGPCGSCWSFATYGSLESSILTEGGVAHDLSENHLKNYHGFDWGPCDGGNSNLSMAYLNRWSGPVDEADDPYHPYDDRPSPGGPPQYYVRETLWFDTDDEIKNAVMTYGALYTTMQWVDTAYRASDQTYYYTGSGGNHGVTIVGWDDAKATAAPTPGAWLIKNSWGATWGDQGYFWLSYADASGANSGVSFQDAVPPTDFSTVHSYDQFGYVQSWNAPYGMNAFTASQDEALKAVQFYTLADGAGYELKVYDNYSGGTVSGLLSTVSGTAQYAGSHTVDLPLAVPVAAGNDFYVVLHVNNGGTYPMAADSRVVGYSSACVGGSGQSYLSFDGVDFIDLYGVSPTGNVCIKALTVAATSGDIGDTINTATPALIGEGSYSVDSQLGDGPYGTRDVDLFQITVSAGSRFSAETSQPVGQATLDTMLRLFDSNGTELAFDDDSGAGFYSRIDHRFASGGVYYVGVTGYANLDYDPFSGGSGIPGATGPYHLQLNVTSDLGDTLATAELAAIDETRFSFDSSIGDGSQGAERRRPVRVRVACRGDGARSDVVAAGRVGNGHDSSPVRCQWRPTCHERRLPGFGGLFADQFYRSRDG